MPDVPDISVEREITEISVEREMERFFPGKIHANLKSEFHHPETGINNTSFRIGSDMVGWNFQPQENGMFWVKLRFRIAIWAVVGLERYMDGSEIDDVLVYLRDSLDRIK
jgi:hypothetical protein